jgi:ER-bound oxygenase mpaB/B'/Rubber oxygenase, catalytic domain
VTAALTEGRWDDAALDAMRRQGDPEADEVVRAHFEAAAERSPAQLFRQLVLHDGGESVVDRYLAERPDPPPWLDTDAIGRAGQWFDRVGVHVFSALYGASLPTAYACHRGAEVLHLTARLETDPTRRLNETAQFLLDVMRRGGMDPGGPGYQAARRVRLMHAAVRWLIAHDARASWEDEWGLPINQEDLLETILTFTQIVFSVFDLTGVMYTDGEADDYLHLWSYVGELLGVHPELLPLDREGAQELMEHVRRRQFGPSTAGALLTHALLGEARQMLPPGFKGLPASTVRWYIGNATADLLRVPASDWTRVLFGPMARLSRIVSAERAHQRILLGVSERFGRGMLTLAVDAERGGDRAAFDIPEELGRSLGVARTTGGRAGSPRLRWRRSGPR